MSKYFIMRLLFHLLVFSFLLSSFIGKAQFQWGATGGVQLNSAILPDVKLNDSWDDILNGGDVVKGVPQYADITYSYRVGGFVKKENSWGFSEIEVTYMTTKIYKEWRFDAGLFGEPTISVFDRDYTYTDIAISHQIFLSSTRKSFIGLGGSLSFLMSYTGDDEPVKQTINVYIKLGAKLSDKVALVVQPTLGVSEVYKDTYIHHLMMPISFQLSFN